MKIKLLCLLICSVPILSSAALENLNADEMHAVTGKSGQILGGADLSWTLSLNHQYANDLSKKNISNINGTEANGIAKVAEADAFYFMRTSDCSLLELCRLAISPNNHFENGNKKWLVFKQIQGTVQIDQFTLSGTTFINQAGAPQSAMRITFYDAKPLKIRNLGFKSLSVESGNEGFLNTTTYSKVGNTTKDVPTFDRGQEKGFMGLNIHGNLHVDGNLKMFSMNCTGTSTSRC
ncbi:hypothetical protein [Acinetobacter schindleri]|uniref:hypothetical protein n=1 Tax=Acinetobacter schindleri TaxID=108981 RepID=UPI002DBC8F09|nr:hypothetical protein [Acinetobacter schindleri]MEB5929655.1 hypothetical protein [Acinetobacter schindleri]